MICEAIVKVRAPQVGVACCGLHLDLSSIDNKEGHVKRAATEIKYQHIPSSFIHLSQPAQSLALPSRGSHVHSLYPCHAATCTI